MTMEQFRVIAKAMKTAYPRDNFIASPEALKLWYNFLGDLPYEILNVAAQKYIVTSKFPPTIAELRELAVQGEESDWGKGWEEVITAMRKYGSWHPKEALESMTATTREVVKRLGWQELCLSENQSVDRANFRMLYEQLSKKKTENAKLPPKLREQITKLQPMMLEEK